MRERQRERKCDDASLRAEKSVCVWVCVRDRERERERKGERERADASLRAERSVCVCE